MAQVTRDRLRAYGEEIAAAVEAAASEFGPEMLELVALFRAAADEEERAVWRSALADAYRAAAADGQEVCAALADELWREAALAENIERKAPAVHNVMGRDEAMARIRSVMACLFERGWDDAKVLRSLQATLRASVEAAPNAAMAESIARASAAQGSLRYARVPADAEACGFCFMISSLGFAYEAKGKSPDHPNHPNCRCRVVPGFEGKTEVEGFDFAAMRGRWEQCEATLALPPDVNGKERDRLIQAECETRDPDWLWFGRVPEITFESDDLKDEIGRERPHELVTAERLRKHGIRCDFVDDSAGLADFASGSEIKTLDGAASRNTIESHLKSASKKRNARVVYFDNSGNGAMGDAELERYLAESRRFRRGSVYAIGHGGTLRKIR